ncbi:aminoglycoside phosphotransferase family protein [Companilactobacillus baiquanensis]|uniref:Aminoglycoside phosphotransferase family protein n=1 Tax=Companilactobacillus baiquanensis TaxID=2486005 RepID=A0ABW1UV98_9LACO|nr:aminoglycoside phosphotransferase family protein [Companilactobacillus baiquanensis]
MTEEIVQKIQTYLDQNDILNKLNLAELKDISFLAQGEYNRNFLIVDKNDQKVVFRINYGSQINVKQQARYEYQALKILSESRHTPEPLWLDDSEEFFEHDILMEKFLPGEPLVYHRDLKKAAQIFASIHNLKLDDTAYQQLIVENSICSDRLHEAWQLLKPIKENQKLAPKSAQILYDLYDWCQEHNADEHFIGQKQCLVNTEVNSNNFLITPDYGWLIDWEKPVISNAVQDLTQFMSDTTTLWRTDEKLSEEQIKDFLTEYAKLTKQPLEKIEENIKVYMPFLLLRALSWCGMLISTYDDKPIKNEEIYNRCQMYLKPEFALPLLQKYGVIL